MIWLMLVPASETPIPDIPPLLWQLLDSAGSPWLWALHLFLQVRPFSPPPQPHKSAELALSLLPLMSHLGEALLGHAT